jgi:hypothetical protein
VEKRRRRRRGRKRRRSWRIKMGSVVLQLVELVQLT